MNDLTLVSSRLNHQKAQVLAEDEKIENQIKKKLEGAEQQRIRQSMLEEQRVAELRDGCDFYDSPMFSKDMASNQWESRF